jgi:hypothetical protein
MKLFFWAQMPQFLIFVWRNFMKQMLFTTLILLSRVGFADTTNQIAEVTGKLIFQQELSQSCDGCRSGTSFYSATLNGTTVYPGKGLFIEPLRTSFGVVEKPECIQFGQQCIPEGKTVRIRGVLRTFDSGYKLIVSISQIQVLNP